jgi:hypothetical protein
VMIGLWLGTTLKGIQVVLIERHVQGLRAVHLEQYVLLLAEKEDILPYLIFSRRGEVNDLSKKHIDVEEDYISLPFEPHEKLVCEYHNFVSVRMFFKTKYDIDITSF